jgi:cysteine-rich repeat protein
VVERGETCDDGNTADGDCCSSSCQLEAAGTSCSDGNACTQADTCDGAGHCSAGTAVTCDDDDLCTDDPVCDPATGCAPSQPKTGLAGVMCRFDAIDALLTQAPAGELTTAARRSIDVAVRKVRTKLQVAAQSTGGRRGAKLLRNAGTALRGATKTINAARRKKQIEGDLAQTVEDLLNQALGGTRALLSSL